ncbi:MAG: histidine phosphatase family protein [Anaerolineae bacterium]|nr:histidine phosphatase family protein [Anaerolineae bacterium]
MVKRVVFIRAGETDWNRLGRWQGWVASPLNAHGQRQAHKLAQFIRNLGLSALYSSDLVRARQTAELLDEVLDFAVVYDERLRERNAGAWQGMTLQEMRDWYPDEFAGLTADPENFRVAGAESRADVRARMRAAFDAAVAADAGETIAIVSHTTAIKLLLDQIIPAAGVFDLDFGNTSVTTIHASQQGWEIVVAQDVSHLDGMESQAVPEVEGNS